MAESNSSKLAKRIHTDGSTHYKGATTPASPVEGDLWYDTSAGALKSYNGSAFVKVSAEIATLTGVTGSILVGTETTLTLAGTGFLTANLVVNFVQSSDGINTDVTVTPSSSTAASVTVPAAVYNNVSNGNAVTIKVTNSDGSTSGTQNTTAKQYPTGGTITTDGNTRIHTFTSSGTFTNYTSNLALTYLVIAGGGGGGGDYGGGGGAGGYRTNKSGQTSGRNSSAEGSLALSTGAKTVTVGAGGAGGIANSTARGNQGSNSIFDVGGSNQTTSTGGGYGTGEGSSPAAGGNGGSGGGAFYSGSGGSGTAGQGFDGGNGQGGPHYSQGGGGGAGSAGANATTSTNGNGGNGLSNNITGSAVTRAGGGGGGYSSDQSIAAGSGGSGGGGNGGAGNSSNGQAGTTNTGSGGGGAGGSGTTTGGAGGSGLVVVSYDVTTI